MCNCFSPPIFLPHIFTSTFTSKLTHKTLLIHTTTIPHLHLQLGKPKRNIPKSTSYSNGYEYFDELRLKEKQETEMPVSSVPTTEQQVETQKGIVEFNEVELDKGILRRGKQMMKRSNMIAKKVISVHSAFSLGFVSQLWVDINSWIVFLVEVRPNLLSGEVEKFLLDDVKQVGDIVLVEDKSVMENEFKLVGLQTLVGYNVATPRQQNIGKEAAASRLQRLTKGLWDGQKMAYAEDEMEDHSDSRNSRAKPEYGRSRRRSSGKKLRKKMKELADDWELPMDFF